MARTTTTKNTTTEPTLADVLAAVNSLVSRVDALEKRPARRARKGAPKAVKEGSRSAYNRQVSAALRDLGVDRADVARTWDSAYVGKSFARTVKGEPAPVAAATVAKNLVKRAA